MDGEEVFDVNQVAQFLGISTAQVKRMALHGTGGFPAGKKVGSGGATTPRRWLKSQIVKWVSDGDEPSPKPPKKKD